MAEKNFKVGYTYHRKLVWLARYIIKIYWNDVYRKDYFWVWVCWLDRFDRLFEDEWIEWDLHV